MNTYHAVTSISGQCAIKIGYLMSCNVSESTQTFNLNSAVDGWRKHQVM